MLVFKAELMRKRLEKEGRSGQIDKASDEAMNLLDGKEVFLSTWHATVNGNDVYFVTSHGEQWNVNIADCVTEPVCTCGNTSGDAGFDPCLVETEEVVEPTVESGWDGWFVCNRCGLLHNFETKEIKCPNIK